MKILDSNTVRYVLLSWVIAVAGTLIPMLQAHKIDIWALSAEALGALIALVARIAQPDIEAPKALNTLSFGLLNRSNPAQKP